jgi:alanine dehydrogenase
MRIGVPKEIKVLESRVGLSPESVLSLTVSGHEVFLETQAGLGSGCPDADYIDAGAQIVPAAAEVFAAAELIVKVKEPQLSECKLLGPQHVLFTYLHLAAVPDIARALCQSGCTAIAYETVTAPTGGLPLLKPMSAIAGRVAIQAGATALQKSQGGSGILISGAAGMAPAKVLILGAGVAGSNAATVALGLQADVTVVDHTPKNRERLATELGAGLKVAVPEQIPELVTKADLIVGAALVTGASAPKLITRDMLQRMRPGSVLVDISIDQGGCFETSRPTTLAEPTFVVDGIVHYCVTNMPGDVPRTSTYALNHATLPFVQALADKGWEQACNDDSHLADGLNVRAGEICHPAVVAALRDSESVA